MSPAIGGSSLKRLPVGELAELRDLYRLEWPKFAFTYYTLDNFVRWQKWFHADELQLYVDPRQDWRLTGSFVAKDYNELFFDTLLEPVEGLKSLLTAIIGSLCGPTISVVHHSRYRDLLGDITSGSSYSKDQDERMVCYRQTVPERGGEEEQCKLPPNYSFDRVRPNDCAFVANQWPHNDPLFVDLPGRLIHRNPSLGVYDDLGKLVAWCLIDQTGALAIFQTVASQQRKGLGRAIISRFSRQLHGEGKLPQAFVVESNAASRSLFEKLGFDVVDYWNWTKFERKQ